MVGTLTFKSDNMSLNLAEVYILQNCFKKRNTRKEKRGRRWVIFKECLKIKMKLAREKRMI